jgi:hypothetical protein
MFLHAPRLLYTLGRHDQLNFPDELSEQERADLDVLGIGGMIATFREVGGLLGPQQHGFKSIRQNRSGNWCGCVYRLTAEESLLLPVALQGRLRISTCGFTSAAEAARGVDR